MKISLELETLVVVILCAILMSLKLSYCKKCEMNKKLIQLKQIDKKVKQIKERLMRDYGTDFKLHGYAQFLPKIQTNFISDFISSAGHFGSKNYFMAVKAYILFKSNLMLKKSDSRLLLKNRFEKMNYSGVSYTITKCFLGIQKNEGDLALLRIPCKIFSFNRNFDFEIFINPNLEIVLFDYSQYVRNSMSPPRVTRYDFYCGLNAISKSFFMSKEKIQFVKNSVIFMKKNFSCDQPRARKFQNKLEITLKNIFYFENFLSLKYFEQGKAFGDLLEFGSDGSQSTLNSADIGIDCVLVFFEIDLERHSILIKFVDDKLTLPLIFNRSKSNLGDYFKNRNDKVINYHQNPSTKGLLYRNLQRFRNLKKKIDFQKSCHVIFLLEKKGIFQRNWNEVIKHLTTLIFKIKKAKKHSKRKILVSLIISDKMNVELMSAETIEAFDLYIFDDFYINSKDDKTLLNFGLDIFTTYSHLVDFSLIYYFAEDIRNDRSTESNISLKFQNCDRNNYLFQAATLTSLVRKQIAHSKIKFFSFKNLESMFDNSEMYKYLNIF